MNSSATGKIGVTSGGIAKIPFIDVFLGARTCRVSSSPAKDDLVAIAGWGTKPSGQRAAELAARLDLPTIFLEDGFLRSYFAGKDHPPLSIVRDSEGIYYDSRRPSALESLLNSKTDLMAGIGADVERARRLILEHRLSKYNHAPDLDEKALRPGDVRRVLVIDQTAGDNSVAMGGATAETETRLGVVVDYLIDLDATSPLRLPEDVQACADLLTETGASCVITGTPAHRSPYFNLVERAPDGTVHLSKQLSSPVLRRQDSPECYDMNASIYGWRRDVLRDDPRVFYPDTQLYVMPRNRSIDIDEEMDFAIVTMIMQQRQAK